MTFDPHISDMLPVAMRKFKNFRTTLQNVTMTTNEKITHYQTVTGQ